MKDIIPELLSPAGNWACLRAAVQSGADSLYFGIKGINMRHQASNFDVMELYKVMEYLHENGKKGYLTLNTIIMQDELIKVANILDIAKKASVDAIILWDFGVLGLAQERGFRVHLSTQASVSNISSVKYFSSLGVKRIVLARECTLEDIKDIKSEINNQNIDCEIETFIHGAMCVSISGRCFLSSYAHNKSANKGQCLQPCRREFLIQDISKEEEFIIGQDYLLSPKDLCSINFLDKLIDGRIDSFKIEGRMRSAEYVKVVTEVYRNAIDLCKSNQFDENARSKLSNDLKKVYNRGFSTGFYFGESKDWQTKGLGNEYDKIYLGYVSRFFKKISVAEVHLKTRGLELNQEILFIGQHTSAQFMIVKEMQIEHESVKKAEKGMIVGIRTPFAVKSKDKIFIWTPKMKKI